MGALLINRPIVHGVHACPKFSCIKFTTFAGGSKLDIPWYYSSINLYIHLVQYFMGVPKANSRVRLRALQKLGMINTVRKLQVAFGMIFYSSESPSGPVWTQRFIFSSPGTFSQGKICPLVCPIYQGTTRVTSCMNIAFDTLNFGQGFHAQLFSVLIPISFESKIYLFLP